MRRDSDLVTSWGMIAMAMLVASVDFSWRLPGCFQFSGFLHRYELQTRIGELYLTSFSIPFSLGEEKVSGTNGTAGGFER